MAAGETPKTNQYFYVKSSGIKEKVLRGLDEDENPKAKEEIRMPLGPGRYVPNSDRMALWNKPISMGEIITKNDEKERAKQSMSQVDSSFFLMGDKRKQMSAGDRAKAMFDEAKETHPNKKVFTKTCKGHPHETIALPTISLRKTLDDLCPSDEDEFGEEEKELGSTHPVKFDEEISEIPVLERGESKRRVALDTMGSISKFGNKLQSQIASTSMAGYATDEERLELIMDHRIKVKTEVPLPFQILLYEETFPVIKSTVKAYREILKKDNELRIEAEDYLKKIERKKKHLQAIKRQT